MEKIQLENYSVKTVSTLPGSVNQNEMLLFSFYTKLFVVLCKIQEPTKLVNRGKDVVQTYVLKMILLPLIK